MATNSAKSSMSIFSSWLAAPNSGVMTYIGTSTSGTMAASPWPMPEVSTMMRSKPAALHAVSTSGRAWLISLPKSRVARLRMNTRCRVSAPSPFKGEDWGEGEMRAAPMSGFTATAPSPRPSP